MSTTREAAGRASAAERTAPGSVSEKSSAKAAGSASRHARERRAESGESRSYTRSAVGLEGAIAKRRISETFRRATGRRSATGSMLSFPTSMLRAGIVGLPNVGKSTLFNALTRTRKAEAANYPFCTIEPNVGIVTVPDERLVPLARIAKTSVLIPATVEFLDIAGLVAGASTGEGLGNRFLSHIREVDAIIEVVRCFEDKDVHHVAGKLDPVADIETITTELVLADLETAQKAMDKAERLAKGQNKEARAEAAFLARLIPHLDSGKPALTFPYSEDEREIVRKLFLLSQKPTLFACNVAEADVATA